MNTYPCTTSLFLALLFLFYLSLNIYLFDHPTWAPYPNKYLSTDVFGGLKLGNRLFEFISIYGLSRKLGRKPLFQWDRTDSRELVAMFDSVMPGLMKQYTILNGTIIEDVEHVPFHTEIYSNPTRLAKYKAKFLNLNGYIFMTYKYFFEYRSDILNFVQPLRQPFADLPVSSSSSFVLCAHSRRTDFMDGLRQGTDPTFMKEAIEFIKNRVNKSSLHIVMFGDDIEFERTVLVNDTLSHVSSHPPNDDMIYSRHHRDYFLLTAPASSFGWWLGYLSKGNEVYYRDIRATNDVDFRSGRLIPADYYPPTWVPLRYDQSRRIMIGPANEERTFGAHRVSGHGPKRNYILAEYSFM